MSPATGFSLEERIRQSLEPLGGPLRIDAFLKLMARERAQKAALEAGEKEAPPARPSRRPPAAAEVPAAENAGRPEREPAPGSDEGLPPLSDSARLRAEVSAFIRRDETGGPTTDDVRDFMDFMGGGGLAPEDPPER